MAVNAMLNGYTKLAIWFLNLVVLLIVVNVGLYFLWLPTLTPDTVYGIDNVMRAYPGWNRKDVAQLLHESLAGGMTYDVIRQVKLQPAQGRFVNVDPAGFRRIEGQASWPPEANAINIFVFGGSTTFGVGLPDSQTIPSELQKSLAAANPSTAVHVYNFGVPTYTSTQELLTYVSLTRQGFVPDVAIFIDGLNDSLFWNGSWGPGDLISARMSHPMLAGVIDLPITKWARRVARLVVTTPPNRIGNRPPEEVGDEVAHRWLSNKAIIEQIAAARGTKVLFVWQPVCTYKYDLRYDILWGLRAARLQFALEAPIQAIYPRIERLNTEGAMGSNFLYLGHIQKNAKNNLYVDGHHYTHEFSAEIAKRIAEFATSKGFLKNPRPAVKSSGTVHLSNPARVAS